MYHKTRFFLPVFFIFVAFTTKNSFSATEITPCSTDNRLCILNEMSVEAESIDNTSWKDQIYRELAKTYAFEGEFEKALAQIAKIATPDTKAMTIRGIGMALAPQKHTQDELNTMFGQLRAEAEKITHPPSYAIALTYIAMGQAFAGDNEGAWKTADSMENDALRHKAFGETAEIQAEKGDYKSAQISITKIDSLAYRNKAYATVSGILADSGLYDDAYQAARAITNPYKNTQALQYLLDAQKPRDVKH